MLVSLAFTDDEHCFLWHDVGNGTQWIPDGLTMDANGSGLDESACLGLRWRKADSNQQVDQF